MLSLIVLVIVAAYLFGSISFSYLAGKILKGIDLREYGSKNLGASNTLRVLGKKAGAVVLLLDSLKGFLCVWGAGVVCAKLVISSDKYILVEICAAIFAILGHVFTVYLKFKGGKGVATALGVFLYLSFWPMVFSFFVWIIVLKTSKYISLASIAGACFLPLFIYLEDIFLGKQTPISLYVFSFVVVILITVKHRQNIKRIIAGTESKIGEKVDA